MAMAKRALHPKDLQSLFGISRSTAYRLCQQPGFPAFRIGKRVVIDPDDLETWKKKGGKVGENCGFPVTG